MADLITITLRRSLAEIVLEAVRARGFYYARRADRRDGGMDALRARPHTDRPIQTGEHRLLLGKAGALRRTAGPVTASVPVSDRMIAKLLEEAGP
jgi:hypothetical protein